MTEYRVLIPDEQPRIIEFIQENRPGVAYLNRSLRDFEPKIVFGWHLSVMLELQETSDDGMPLKIEQEVLDELGEIFDVNIKGQDKEKPNAIFLARITWNKTRELIWRVYDPELANNYLNRVISDSSFPRLFDYRIDPDEEWKLAEWHLTS